MTVRSDGLIQVSPPFMDIGDFGGQNIQENSIYLHLVNEKEDIYSKIMMQNNGNNENGFSLLQNS